MLYGELVNKVKELTISQQSIHEYFLKEKSAKDNVIFSMIKTNNKYSAEELYFRIKDDKQDFDNVAKAYATSSNTVYQGAIGPIPINKINPELRNAIVNMTEGSIHKPIPLNDTNYVLLKLIKANNLQLNPSIENTIRNTPFEKWLESQISTNKFIEES